MDELTQLANALMSLDDKLAACMKCGFCQAFCPMYMTTRIEGDLTRGKIALVENLAHRIIEDPEAVNEKLSRSLRRGLLWRHIWGFRPSRRPRFGCCSPIRACSVRCCV